LIFEGIKGDSSVIIINLSKNSSLGIHNLWTLPNPGPSYNGLSVQWERQF